MAFMASLSHKDRIIWMGVIRHIMERLGGGRTLRYSVMA